MRDFFSICLNINPQVNTKAVELRSSSHFMARLEENMQRLQQSSLNILHLKVWIATQGRGFWRSEWSLTIWKIPYCSLTWSFLTDEKFSFQLLTWTKVKSFSDIHTSRIHEFGLHYTRDFYKIKDFKGLYHSILSLPEQTISIWWYITFGTLKNTVFMKYELFSQTPFPIESKTSRSEAPPFTPCRCCLIHDILDHMFKENENV